MDPDIYIMSWAKVAARQSDMGRLLGAETRVIRPNLRSTLIRCLYNACLTFRFVRSVPKCSAFVVVAPPVFLPALVLCFGWRKELRLVMDRHPGAFGLMNDWFSRLLGPIHRSCIRRAELVLVTTDELRKTVELAGGRGLVFHEPYVEPATVSDIRAPIEGRFAVVFAGNFSRDKPIGVVAEAASQLPEVEFYVTGEPSRTGRSLETDNVHLTGWLDRENYEARVVESDVVVVLTTDEDSVMRAAIEAIRMGKTLIVSNTRSTRQYFPHAWHVENSSIALTEALKAIRRSSELDLIESREAALREDHRIAMKQQADLFSAIQNVRMARHRT